MTSNSIQGVSVADAAAALDVTQTTVRRMIRRGDIEAWRVGPKLIRVNLESVRITPLGSAQAA